MTLEEIVSARRSVALQLIGADVELATDVQNRLTAIGLLDPPADGVFGPVSHWTLGQVARRLDITGTPVRDKTLAEELLNGTASSLFPLKAAATFAGRIAAALRKAGHWLCRHPDCANVVYIEGIDADGAPNVFNDLRLILRVNRAGNPGVVEAWEGTTEPGRYAS